jgi:hypothetical protein
MPGRIIWWDERIAGNRHYPQVSIENNSGYDKLLLSIVNPWGYDEM